MEKVLVDRLREGPETKIIDAAPAEFDLADQMFTFPDRVQGELEFKLVGQDVRGVGHLETNAATACVRCLDPIRCHLDVPVDEIWLFRDPEAHHYKDPESDEILAQYYEGETIDPRSALRELIMFELPDFPRCSEDCKGLCPRCGANLNREPCRCPPPAEAETEAMASDWKSKLAQIRDRSK